MSGSLPAEKSRSVSEIIVVGAVTLAAFVFTLWYLPAYRAAGGASQFYQNEFGPSVMLTCGRGFVNADPTLAPAFAAFLTQQVDGLQCSDVPATIRIMELNGLQGITRYLMTAVSLVWRVTGISWKSLDVLFAAFVAATVVSAYVVLRFVCGRTVSLALTFFWALSPWHLQNIPHLRDYSKAPFFMFLLVAMAVAFVERRPRRLLLLGIVYGVVQGIGFGMRTDVVLNFLPFFIILFAAPPDGVFRTIKPRVMCAVAAIGLFAVVSYPVLQTYTRNISLWHIALLGLTSPYDENLGIGFPRPAYGFPYAHNDAYIDTVVRSHAAEVHPDSPPFVMLSRAYDQACQEYFALLATTFPGDLMTRMVASVERVLNFPFGQPQGHVPVGVSNPTLRSLWEARASLMKTFDGAGPWLMAAVVLLIGMESVRYACVAGVLLWIWAAYPAIEFQWRHIFQFEFPVLGAVALGCTLLWRQLRGLRAGASGEILKKTAWSLATVAGLVGFVGVAVLIARMVQVPRAKALLVSYANTSLDPLTPTAIPLAEGTVRLSADVFGSAVPIGNVRTGRVQTTMIAADFEADRCGQKWLLDATFRYEESDPRFALDFSRQMTVPLSPAGGAPTRVFFPAYSVDRSETGGGRSRFVGVDVPAGSESCVRLWQVRNPGAFPLLLTATLTSDWQDKLYQRLPIEQGLRR